MRSAVLPAAIMRAASSSTMPTMELGARACVGVCVCVCVCVCLGCVCVCVCVCACACTCVHVHVHVSVHVCVHVCGHVHVHVHVHGLVYLIVFFLVNLCVCVCVCGVGGVGGGWRGGVGQAGCVLCWAASSPGLRWGKEGKLIRPGECRRRLARASSAPCWCAPTRNARARGARRRRPCRAR